LTIEDLAGEANLHTVSLSRIENGRRNVTWMALSSLAAGLEVEIINLVHLATEQQSHR
jgi:transcriptional regulator with XRE-family HTH domain